MLQMDNEREMDKNASCMMRYAPAWRQFWREMLDDWSSVFDEDFGAIRLCLGDRILHDLGPPAYSLASEIHIDSLYFDPQSVHGRLLLAHEMVHVVQQRHGLLLPKCRRESGEKQYDVWVQCESEARKVAPLVSESRRVQVECVADPQIPLAFDTGFKFVRPLHFVYFHSVLDVQSKFETKVNKKEGHEVITKEALTALMDLNWGKKPDGSFPALDLSQGLLKPDDYRKPESSCSCQELLIRGNRRVDVPQSLDDENLADLDKIGINITSEDPLKVEVYSQNSLLSKYRDNDAESAMQDFDTLQDDPDHQRTHFMYTPGKTPMDSFDLAISWIKQGMSGDGGIQGGTDAARSGNMLEATKHFGNALHCIQDSFSQAHTTREKQGDASRIRKIMRYRDDNGKLTGEHKSEFDDVDGQGREGRNMATLATRDYLDNVSRILFYKEQGVDWKSFFDKWFLPPQAQLKLDSKPSRKQSK